MFTKRVATLGPSTDALGVGQLYNLLDLVDGVRINLAHASPEEVEKRVRAVRKYEEERGRVVAVLLDLKGPSVRVAATPQIPLQQGDVVAFRLSEKSDGSYIPVPQRVFFQVVERGDYVLMLDGKLRLKVVDVAADSVVAVAESSGVVEAGKAVVVEGKDYDLPSPSEDDVNALRNISRLGVEVDYVAVSLVKSCKDVDNARRLLAELGLESGVVVKVETKSAVDGVEELAQCGDYIVVARGDLGLHYGLETLPKVQRAVVESSIRLGKPVAVATQLLDSVQSSPTPTRAEVNDVYITASMGVDSLWLTNETASGKYPLEAVKWLTKILERVEYNIAQRPPLLNTRDRFAKALVEMAQDLGAALLVYSMSGTLARRVAKFRPLTTVYVGTPSVKTARALRVIWALEPIYLPARDYEEGLEKLINLVNKKPYVATYGIRGGAHTVKLRF
ncbi:MAG: pyruvate kinase [Pyrobaculum sp.]